MGNTNMSDEDNQFIQGDSGALDIELVEAGRRKPGSLLMMKETFPCKVVGFSTAKQYEESYGTGDMIPAPVVVNTEYQCIDLEDDGTLILMTKDGEMKEDLKLSDAGHLKTMAKEIKKIQDDGKKECLARC